MNRKPLIFIIAILFLALLYWMLVFFKNDSDLNSLEDPINNQTADILNKIKNKKEIPDSQIDNAIITIRDDSHITAKIKCDTLIKYDTRPTLLIGNIVATFYDSIGPLSVLKSDFAEYAESDSLVAKKNITMYNLRMKDSLFFINQEVAQVVWDRYYSKVISNNEFILKDSTSRCTKGSKFQSNLDLSEIKIENSQGTNDCK